MKPEVFHTFLTLPNPNKQTMLGGIKCPRGQDAKNFFYFRFPIGSPLIHCPIEPLGGMDIDLGDVSIMDIDINTIIQMVDQNGPIQFEI